LALGWASLQTVRSATLSDDFIQGYANAVIALNYPAIEYFGLGLHFFPANGGFILATTFWLVSVFFTQIAGSVIKRWILDIV
jgi:hypothetical protein